MDTPPLLRRFFRVSKTHELLHGIKADFLDDDGPFPLDVKHVFDKSCHI
jgi:hypothetical protein